MADFSRSAYVRTYILKGNFMTSVWIMWVSSFSSVHIYRLSTLLTGEDHQWLIAYPLTSHQTDHVDIPLAPPVDWWPPV